ncbi:SHD1 domain-containing protein [Poriferisphaera sp. WC338]|uniref:SHD1 domain-containing protein n=1 Tax=Poriferisphaera sp. WC338 TaxID=3425129 RepID=UPI003D8182EA
MKSTLICFLGLLAFFCLPTLLSAELYTPPEDAPAYSLSSPQITTDNFGRPAITIKYTRKKAGSYGATLVTFNKDQTSPVHFASLNENAGTIHLQKMHSFGSQQPNDIGFYITSFVKLADEVPVTFLVSNVVHIGNPGKSITAQRWDERITAAYEKHLRGFEPPAFLPEGHRYINDDIELLPGMPVKVGRFGEWKDAEYICDAPRIKAKVLLPGREKTITVKRKQWLAIASATLEQAKVNPKQFTPSIQIIEGSDSPIPEGMVPLPSNTKLVIGTPLYQDQLGWKKCFVAYASGNNVTIRSENNLNPAFDKDKKYSELLIEEKTLKQLEHPKSSFSKFAKNLIPQKTSQRKRFKKTPEQALLLKGGYAFARPLARKDHPIRDRIPSSAQPLPHGIPLPAGTQLQACFFRDLEPVTVLSTNHDGSVNIHWDDRNDSWDCSLTRDQLVISKRMLSKLNAATKRAARKETLQQAKQTAALIKELQTNLRTWTDSSGQHRIQATFLRRTEDNTVVLLTSDSKEIVLPFNKLSEEDQAILTPIPAEVENPFKTSENTNPFE